MITEKTSSCKLPNNKSLNEGILTMRGPTWFIVVIDLRSIWFRIWTMTMRSQMTQIQTSDLKKMEKSKLGLRIVTIETVSLEWIHQSRLF